MGTQPPWIASPMPDCPQGNKVLLGHLTEGWDVTRDCQETLGVATLLSPHPRNSQQHLGGQGWNSGGPSETRNDLENASRNSRLDGNIEQ